MKDDAWKCILVVFTCLFLGSFLVALPWICLRTPAPPQSVRVALPDGRVLQGKARLDGGTLEVVLEKEGRP